VTEERWADLKRLLWQLAKPAIVAMIVALLVSMGVQMTAPPGAVSGDLLSVMGITHLSGLNVTGAVDLDSTVNADGAVTLGSTVHVTGAALFASTVGASSHISTAGKSQLGTWLVSDKRTKITVTEGGYITPTGTLQEIDAAGAVTPTGGVAAGAAGSWLILWNSGSNTIRLIDTGALMLSGNLDLGQYDTVILVSDGTNWLQVGTSNN